MFKFSNKYVVTSSLILLLGSMPASSSDAARAPSDALELALPSLVMQGDYRAASKLSFQLAAARSQQNETSEACLALSLSLAHYRTALARETGEPAFTAASDTGTDDDGMQYIRARFGCTAAQFS